MLQTRHPVTGAIRLVTPALLAEVYLAPRPLPFAPDPAAIDAPWSASLQSAPLETALAVDRALRRLIESVPTLRPDIDLSRLAPSRARDHLEALIRLWQSCGDALPEDLHPVRHVLETADFLELLPIIDAPDPHASAAQQALRARLIAHHGALPFDPAPFAQGSLGHLQRNMLAANVERLPNDGSLAFYGLRDTAQQADFAAARAQALIAAGAAPQDIAVISPEAAHMARAFAAVGVPLTGLAAPDTRDIAGETLLHALQTLGPLTPTMARASLYTSVLMPWPADTGTRMAAELMGGKRRRAKDTLTGKAAQLYEALHTGAATAKQLRFKLELLAEAAPTLRARIYALPIADPLDWDALIRAAQPGATTRPDPIRHVEGVSLTADLPWRPAKHLIVAGFTAGAYPAPAPNDPFFLDSELAAIAEATGIAMPGRAAHLARSLDLFQRQIASATETITFLQPMRGGDGVRLHPSTGLALVGRTVAADVIDLHATAKWPCAAHYVLPRPTDIAIPEGGTIHLGHDLLRLRMDESGVAIPQSPSRLENLLVSPLAWLMAEAGAEDSPWQPDAPDIMTTGSIYHQILEHLFPAGPLCAADTIAAGVAEHLQQAIRDHAPYMLAPAWALERETLHREALRAATAWHALLETEGAEVIATEISLHGEAHGIIIRGYADCILRLADGQLLIVDHKSSGTRSRRERMEAGWDLQLGLYRDMLARPISGDIPNGKAGVAYHLLRDSGVLHHGLDGATTRMEAVTGDISAEALGLLRTRLAEVGAGTIRLNHPDDEQTFKRDAKLTAYALEGNALAAAFRYGDAE